MTDIPDEIMERARACGEMLLDDITDRRGWRQEWDQFDEDVREEIRQAHAAIIARAITEAEERGAARERDGGRWWPMEYREGHKDCVEWLHARAASMNDPHAKAILNAAAFDLGNVKGKVSRARGKD